MYLPLLYCIKEVVCRLYEMLYPCIYNVVISCWKSGAYGYVICRGGTDIDEGVTPRLLRIDLPGVPEDKRPMKIQPRPDSWHRRRSLQLTRKVRRSAVRSKLGLGKL